MKKVKFVVLVVLVFGIFFSIACSNEEITNNNNNNSDILSKYFIDSINL